MMGYFMDRGSGLFIPGPSDRKGGWACPEVEWLKRFLRVLLHCLIQGTHTWSCSGVPQELQPRSKDSLVLGGAGGGMAARALVLEQNSGYSEENLS